MLSKNSQSKPPRTIHCKLTDCYYYRFYPEGSTSVHSSGLAICHYPENDLILEFEACRFYRLDWAKKLKNLPKKD